MSLSFLLPARYRVATDPVRSERRVELLLVVLLAVLVLQLLWTGLRLSGLEQPEPVAPAADSMQVRELIEVAEIGQAQRAELRDRPLFWATRRVQTAAQPAADQQEQKAGEIAGVRLAGIFGSGDSAGIIVTLKETGRKRLRIGDKVNGWQLQSVQGSEAVLTAGGRNKTLALKAGSGAAKGNSAAKARKTRRSARAR